MLVRAELLLDMLSAAERLDLALEIWETHLQQRHSWHLLAMLDLPLSILLYHIVPYCTHTTIPPHGAKEPDALRHAMAEASRLRAVDEGILTYAQAWHIVAYHGMELH